ncbi:MAG: hypothetical protein HC902_01575, partial [Calothrix sp. SM1_5_4]|nr:hypothetical protein [Calothrix sp. SM1_5_4]
PIGSTRNLPYWGIVAPYDVEVVVTRERRVLRGERFTYVVVGVEEDLTQQLGQQLRGELTKRREDRNIIDDFRAY